ncbi:peptidoglycan DD-metalloendopeptidase family protein [Flindersiella endophytica]
MRTLMRLGGYVLGVLGLIAATMLAVPTTAQAAPVFKAPFPCGQRWTYSHHSAEVRQALDFIRSDGGTTNGTPVLASAAGTAYRFNQPGGAGQYIAVEHGGGWKTYYFHLGSYSVANGQAVAQGQQVGTTGATGNVTGPHIHYEQLYNGVGQVIVINGASLAPYPSTYGSKHLTSDNGCSGGGKPFMTWGSGVNVRSGPHVSSSVVTTLSGPTLVYVLCQVQGDTVTAEGYTNNWWSKLRDQNGYMTNIYIDDPNAHLPGVPDC